MSRLPLLLTAAVLGSSREHIFYEPSAAARAWFPLALATIKSWQGELAAGHAPGRRLVPAGPERARLLAVPPEVANSGSVRQRLSLALTAADAYLRAPSSSTRLRLQQAIGALQQPARPGR